MNAIHKPNCCVCSIGRLLVKLLIITLLNPYSKEEWINNNLLTIMPCRHLFVFKIMKGDCPRHYINSRQLEIFTDICFYCFKCFQICQCNGYQFQSKTVFFSAMKQSACQQLNLVLHPLTFLISFFQLTSVSAFIVFLVLGRISHVPFF